MKPSLLIALRYLFSKKKRNAINIISRIAVLAFAVCTAALIIILSTMNGFEHLIFSMYNKFNPEIKVSLTAGKVFESQSVINKIKTIEGVAFVLPALEDNAVIQNGDYQTVCTVKGVDSQYFAVNDLQVLLNSGEAIVKDKGVNYVLMGAGISQKINADASGPFNQINLISPRRGQFSVSDIEAVNTMSIVPSGVLTLDESMSNKYVFVPLDFAQTLFDRPSQASMLEVHVNNSTSINQLKLKLQSILGPSFKVQDRMEQQASLYKMFRSEKWASYAILTFVLLIAAFNALGSLTMLVMEKKQDIKTLSYIGARPQLIRSIFFNNGFLLAALGTTIGLLIGITLVLLQDHYGLIKMQGAIVENYPVQLQLSDVVLIAVTALGLGVITGLYPARKAVQLMEKH
jgi:ABC-type lipoprotein release transport system permease subunit